MVVGKTKVKVNSPSLPRNRDTKAGLPIVCIEQKERIGKEFRPLWSGSSRIP